MFTTKRNPETNTTCSIRFNPIVFRSLLSEIEGYPRQTSHCPESCMLSKTSKIGTVLGTRKKQIIPSVVIALATPYRSRTGTSRTLGILHIPLNLAYPCCVVQGSTPLTCNDNDDVETNCAFAERHPALLIELCLECTSETLAVVELQFRVL
jgi:hypothetical protein